MPLSALVALGAMSTAALAQEASPAPPPTPPPLPTNVGPGTVKPPPPPVLPGKGKKGGRKGNKGKKDGRAGNEGGTPKGGKGKGGKSGKAGSELRASCGAFEFVQTYPNWGPALSYGRPVTVSYAATRCARPRGRALDLSVQGTATVHDVPLAGGALIETKPFSVTGTWRNPRNAEGWPPPWWSCGVRFAEYSWEISDLYRFGVTAREGRWSLNVVTEGATRKTVAWSYDAC